MFFGLSALRHRHHPKRNPRDAEVRCIHLGLCEARLVPMSGLYAYVLHHLLKFHWLVEDSGNQGQSLKAWSLHLMRRC